MEKDALLSALFPIFFKYQTSASRDNNVARVINVIFLPDGLGLPVQSSGWATRAMAAGIGDACGCAAELIGQGEKSSTSNRLQIVSMQKALNQRLQEEKKVGRGRGFLQNSV